MLAEVTLIMESTVHITKYREKLSSLPSYLGKPYHRKNGENASSEYKSKDCRQKPKHTQATCPVYKNDYFEGSSQNAPNPYKTLPLPFALPTK